MRFRIVTALLGALGLTCAFFARPALAEVCAADVLLTAPRFPVGDTPEGTLAGDFNNDSLPDVLTIASQGLTVLLGDGAGGFGPPTTSPSSARLPIVQGFFDDDENLDIASTYGSSLVIQLGNGDGTFQDEVFYAGADHPADMHVGYFDGDLFLDIIQSDSDTGNVYVLLGYGDGTFQAGIGSSEGLSRSISVGDFTGDGKLDVIGSVLFSSDAHLAPGNGDGTFGPPITVPFGHEIGPLTAADFNNDGKLDLAAGYDTVVAVRRGNGNGTFQPALEIPLPTDRSASTLLPVDWDADGDMDLAVSQASSLLPLLQQPGGTFATGRAYLLEGGPIATDDFDDDGLPDFVMANYYEEAIILLRSLGVGDYAAPRSVPVDLAPYDLGVGDFDGDGDDDFAVLGSHFDTQIAIVLNEGGTFRTANTLGGGSHLLVADFDTDGALDIATIGFYGVIVYRGHGDGTFENVGGLPLIAGMNLTAADFDHDGILDLALIAGGSSDGELTILLGLGDATFAALPPLHLEPPASDLVGADFDEDGAADLILTVGGCCNGAYSIQFLRSNGDGTFQDAVPYFAGPAPFLPRAGDFDGDGHLDVLIASADSSNVALFLGDGTGAFGPADLVATGWPMADLETGDFDADGHLDFVTANGEHNVSGDSISVLLGTGNGTFLAPQEYATSREPPGRGIREPRTGRRTWHRRGQRRRLGRHDLRRSRFLGRVHRRSHGDGRFDRGADGPRGGTRRSHVHLAQRRRSARQRRTRERRTHVDPPHRAGGVRRRRDLRGRGGRCLRRDRAPFRVPVRRVRRRSGVVAVLRRHPRDCGGRHHGRLRRRELLSRGAGAPGPDGRVSAQGRARRRLLGASLRRHLRRRALPRFVRSLDRDPRRRGHHERLRHRHVLPRSLRHARADGRLSAEDPRRPDVRPAPGDRRLWRRSVGRVRG